MDWAKRSISTGWLSTADVPSYAAGQSALVTEARPSEFTFGLSEVDRRLESQWHAYYRCATGPYTAHKDTRFHEFVDCFVSGYEDWHPGLQSDSGEACVTGHPALVIASLACNFKTIVHVICQTLQRPFSGDAPLLPRRTLLHLLVILSRSRDNRIAFLRWDVHQAFVRLLRAFCGHMKSVVQCSTWKWADVCEWWTEMELWLAEILRLIANFADPSFCWTAKYMATAGPGLEDESTGCHSSWANEPAQLRSQTLKVLKDTMPILVQALCNCEQLSNMSEVPPDRYELQELLLMTMGSVVSLTAYLQKSQPTSDTAMLDATKVIIMMSGWPKHMEFVHPAVGGHSDELVKCTYRSRLLLLRVLCELLRYDSDSVETFLQHGRCQIIGCILWAGIYFCKPDLITHQPGAEPSDCLEMWSKSHNELLLECVPVQTLFSTLGSICIATCYRTGTFDPRITRLYFEVVSSGLANKQAALASEYFRTDNPVLQLYAAQALTLACQRQPSIVEAIRSSTGLLAMAFGSEFYEFAVDPATCNAHLPRLLRSSVLNLVHVTATTRWPTNNPTNIVECKLLLHLAGQHVATSHHGLVADVGCCLERLIVANQELSHQSFTELGALHRLGQILDSLRAAASRENENRSSADAHKARYYMFAVCTRFLETNAARLQALCQPDMKFINVLFCLLEIAQCRIFAVGALNLCMLARANSDESDDNKAALFSRYTAYISSILDNHIEQPLHLVGLMLLGVIRVVEGTPESHQTLFREKTMCFLHIVTFWNNWKYCEAETEMVGLTVTMINTITVLIAGNDKSKAFFADTIGYDQLQELLMRLGPASVPLVDSVYCMIFDGKCEQARSRKIQNSDCIATFIKLLATREPQFETGRLDVFLADLSKFSTNVQSCCDVGILDMLIEHLLDVEDIDLQAKILQLIQVIGTHSITAKQLRSLLTVLANAADAGCNMPGASMMLKTLHGMYLDSGAANFLDFDGIASGLHLRETIDRWPSRSYSFCVWLKIETLQCQTSPLESYEPRLFSFLSKQGFGVECFFRANSLVLRVLHSRGTNEATAGFPNGEPLRFETGEWYHIAIVHRNSRPLGQSEVSFFINGAQISPASRLQYPDATGGIEGFVGTNSEQPVLSLDGNIQVVPRMPLCCQMSTIYFFDDIVSSDDIASIHSFGPNHMAPSFQPTDDPCMAPGIEKTRLVDGKLSSRIWLSYNAKACDGDTCFDTTPEINGHVGWDARLLKRTSTVGTRPCVTRKLKDAMNAVGGAKLVFPLFERLASMPCAAASDVEDAETASEPGDFLESLFKLVQSMLREPTNLSFVVRNNGLQAIQWLLRQAPPECLVPSTLTEISKVGKIFPDRVDQITSHRCLLLGSHVLTKTSTEVQCEAIHQLQQIYIADVYMFQQLCGVQGLLDILCKYYDSEEQAIDSRPQIRLIDFIRRYLQEQYTDQDLGHVLGFLANTSNTGQLHNILLVLYGLSASQPQLKASLSIYNNVAMIATWLDHPSEQVRCDVILLLSRLVVPRAQAQDAAGRAMLHTVITSVRRRAVTGNVRTALFNASLDNATAASLLIIQKGDEIKNAGFMIVLLDAALDSIEVSATESLNDPPADQWHHTRIILEAIDAVLGLSVRSCDQFYSMAGWQEILIRVFSIPGCSEVEKLVFQIFCCLHMHAFQQARVRGWHVLAESLAHINNAQLVDGLLIRCTFCSDLLLKLEMFGTTTVWYLDNMSHLMLIVEDLLFDTTVQHDTISGGCSNSCLAEAALTILERPDLCIVDFEGLNTSELPTLSFRARPGGLARIACRIFVAVATGSASDAAERIQLRMHKYLARLHMASEPTGSVFTYALAKLLQAGKLHSCSGRSNTVARMVQHFVREFDTIDGMLRSTTDDPETARREVSIAARLRRHIRATLADDEFQRVQLSADEYDLYVARVYLSAEWIRLLEACPLLLAESQRSSVDGYSTPQPSHFPGYDYSSDNDEIGARAFQDRGRTKRAELGSIEIRRITEATRADQLSVRNSERAWGKINRSLIHECSPGSHSDGSHSSKFWKLDRMEGTSRKRLLLRRNYSGSTHANASKHTNTTLSTDDRDKGPDLNTGLEFQPAAADQGEDSDYEDGQEIATDLADVSASEPQPDETRIFSCAADIVKPMRHVHGRFEISASHLYFFPESPEHEGDPKQSTPTAGKDRKWELRHVTEIHPRRYLLRHSAIEIFTDDMTNYFINFGRVELCRDVIRKLLGLRLRHLTIVTRRTRSRLLKEATSKWRERRMTNFDYIMQVNTLSGRTYNDISQYPIFPWVIADYSSSVLDLTAKRTFRDLSKPIGALNPERLDYLVERAKAFEDPEVGLPKFLYGSHYSSGAITLYYLIRMEPFTTLAIELQGGTFDHADRMFHSMASTWAGVMNGNQDFKELTPEFFYMPEFFANQNGLDLGTTQQGDILGDVVLPPWAADADEFVRLNRAALESEFVSANLHQWMDLVFGSKQRGPEAEAAHNLFYHLTYEGTVDLDSIDDPQMRKATEEQILEYGQTPTQLFSRDHPTRNRVRETGPSLGTTSSPLTACFEADAAQQPILFLHPYSDSIVTLSAARCVGHHRWMPFPNFQGAPFTFERDRRSSFSRTRIGVDFSRCVNLSQECFAVTSDGSFLLSCGHWDATFKVSHVDSGRVLQLGRRESLCVWQTVGQQHKDIVTSLSLGEDGTTLVTGSLDATVAVWDVAPSSATSVPIVSSAPRAVLYGHRDEITCTAVHTGLGIVASASKHGPCLLHKARGGSYIRSIPSPADAAESAVSTPRSVAAGHGDAAASFGKVLVSCNGAVVLYSPADLTLQLFTVNGKMRCAADATERVNAWALTPDGDFLLTGSERMVLKLRCLHSLRVLHTFARVEAPVCSLAIAPNENVCLVGLANGSIAVAVLPSGGLALASSPPRIAV